MTGTPLGRIVDIAQEGRYLSKDVGFLLVRSKEAEVARIPLEDLAAVVATAPGTTVTCALLAEFAARGVAFVVCGAAYSPAALLWPVEGHHAQQRHMENQIAATRPLAKRLWCLIVSAKVRKQAWALMKVRGDDGGLLRLADVVTSGDPKNIEAQAARRYWGMLFGTEFRRDQSGGSVNSLLNYGYAVLRGATARAVAAAGLHPSVGIFHRHPHNAMPLADDLMEPFRPTIDVAVHRLVSEGVTDVTPEAKRALVATLFQPDPMGTGSSPLSTCLFRLAQSLAESYNTGKVNLDLPSRVVHRRDKRSE